MPEQYQFPQVGAFSRCVLGHARAQLGRASEGIALIRQGLAEALKAGARLPIRTWAGYLATAQEREGAIADALETIEQARPRTPEILKLRGELRLKQGRTELAEADFSEAIARAQKMGAKVWELSATMSLARLIARQGRRDEARTMLAEIYSWFTEGFDTADLKDAKALLDELGA